MSNMIKLANGREVTLDEFLTWSYQKQHGNLNPSKFSDETRAKMSASQKGRTLTAETRVKLSAAMKGRTLTAEHRAKIGAAKKGRTQSAEHRAKLGAARKGRTHSAEARAKLGAAHVKPVMTPNGLYPSLKAVREASGVTAPTIRRWMKKWPEHYYYV